MGGRDATVNLGLSLVPVQFLAAGLFVIAAFMGTATGTSMGTISAITPIAVGVAEKGGLNMMVVLGAVIGGAMFGDNLSMISDTTIAATRSQHCEMRDKFRVNFLTALPAALVTIVVLLIVGRPETVTEIGDLSYSFIKVIPYLLVLILALVGMNVFLVLTIGIFAAGIVGIATGAIDLAGFAQAVYNGFCGMNEVFFLTLLCGGMSELIAKNGGIEWIIQKLGKVMKGNKSAQVGIAAMVSLCDCATANNTVAIIVAGDMAREVSHGQKHEPYPQSGSPPHRLPAGHLLLRVPGHHPLRRAAPGSFLPVQRYRYQRHHHQRRQRPWLSVVLLVPGCFRHPVHLHPLRRWHLPQGSLELGV